MAVKFRKRTGVFLLIGINCLLLGCNYDTKETIDKTNTLLPNGKHLTLEKTNKSTKATGIFSKHDYGTTHSFTYKLSINPGNINWNGGSGEPKDILFFKDTTYIRFLKEKTIRIEYTDSINDTIKSYHKTEIQAFYEKHIDKRYFFKLLGEDYWVSISPEDYYSVDKSCDEFPVPNDNELSLKPIVNDELKN